MSELMKRKYMSKSSTRIGLRGRALFLLLSAAILPLAVLAGCKKDEAPEVQATVQAEHPEQGSISSQITADAVLAPLAQAAIVSKISSPVSKYYVERGARVKEGELLVALENKDLTAVAQDNQGSYEAAQAAFDTATKAQVPEDALKAEADLAEAKANLGLAQSIVNSRKQLFAEGAIPGRDLDTAQAALVQAQATYGAAAKHAESMKSVSHEAALKAAHGQLTSAEGKLKDAQADVSYSEIRSPIDGVVTDRPFFPGETAPAGTPVITVMDTAFLLAKAHIAQSVMQQIKIGGEAQIHVPGIGDPVPAKVSMVSPALDPGSTTVEVWLKIDNKAGTLKAGTPVKVSITGQTIENAWKVPVSAVLTGDDGAKTVMIVGSDGAAHKKPVTLGITDGDDIQVLTGIAPGDMVITGGSYGLDDGTKVKIGKAEDNDDDAKPGAAAKNHDKPGAAMATESTTLMRAASERLPHRRCLHAMGGEKV
jgi:HlyD family secretion protein